MYFGFQLSWLLCWLLEAGGVFSVSASGVHSVILAGGSWSPWSPWSPCSRSCGSEGLQTRRRVCLTALGCQGNSNAWRACALTPCPEEENIVSSLRDEQCARHNSVPYEGAYHMWRGALQADSPCSLDCQAETRPDVIQRFATRVEDGTRCSDSGSLKLCLGGVCEVRPTVLISKVVRDLSWDVPDNFDIDSARLCRVMITCSICST